MWTPASVLVFLTMSGFFLTWDGQAVSVRPTEAEAPSSYRVLISDGEDFALEQTWPAAVVEPLNLPVDTLGIPPADIPGDRPRTRKAQFQLTFLLERVGEGKTGFQAVGTTSPWSLGVGLGVFLLGVAARNTIRGGRPWAFDARADEPMVTQQAQAGVPARSQGGRSRKGPPPPKPRRGRRR